MTDLSNLAAQTAAAPDSGVLLPSGIALERENAALREALGAAY